MRRIPALTGTPLVKAIIGFALFMAVAGLQAQSRMIDQQWQFRPDPKAQFTAIAVDRQAKWRPAKAGLSWNAQFDDLATMRGWAGSGHDRVAAAAVVQPGADSLRRRRHFELSINGRRLEEHEGGYTPFTFDLTGKVRAGNNEILVKVFDPPMPPPLAVQMPAKLCAQRGPRPPGAKNNAEPPLDKRLDYNEIPHGKQNWYVQTGGLWQAVTLETVPLRYVAWVHVTPHNSGDVTVEAGLAGHAGRVHLRPRFFDPYGATVAAPACGGRTAAQGKTLVATPMFRTATTLTSIRWS